MQNMLGGDEISGRIEKANNPGVAGGRRSVGVAVILFRVIREERPL